MKSSSRSRGRRLWGKHLALSMPLLYPNTFLSSSFSSSFDVHTTLCLPFSSLSNGFPVPFPFPYIHVFLSHRLPLLLMLILLLYPIYFPISFSFSFLAHVHAFLCSPVSFLLCPCPVMLPYPPIFVWSCSLISSYVSLFSSPCPYPCSHVSSSYFNSSLSPSVFFLRIHLLYSPHYYFQ